MFRAWGGKVLGFAFEFRVFAFGCRAWGFDAAFRCKRTSPNVYVERRGPSQ